MSGEKLRDFGDSARERVAQLVRLGQNVSDRVQRQQLAIAAADFRLGQFVFGDVQNEALVGDDGAGIVACDKARLARDADFAVAAAKLKLEIGDFAVLVQKAL